MKKMLGKRFMFLVALIMSLCMPVKAQTDMGGVALNETTVYYIQNAATGLFIKYGCTWGMDAGEGRAGHPFMVTANEDGTYALSSVAGYLSSNVAVGPYIDRPLDESKWTLVQSTNSKVPNGWILLDDAGQALASQGQDVGQLGKATFNSGDLLQSWVFITESQFRSSVMANATASAPVDISQLIKASSFDIADGISVRGLVCERNGVEVPISVPLNGKLLNVNNYYYQTYNSYWTNYFDRDLSTPTEFDGVSRFVWHSQVRSAEPNTYNGVGIIQSSGHGKSSFFGYEYGNGSTDAVIVSQSLTLPAGTYYFSFEGFYHYQIVTQTWNEERSGRLDAFDEVPNTKKEVSVTSCNDTYAPTITLSAGSKTFNLARNENIDVSTRLSEVNDKGELIYELPGQRAAIEFRDYDNYKQEYTFTLTQETTVTISINKPESNKNTTTYVVTEQGGSLIKYDKKRTATHTEYPAWICLDNFTLIYYGNNVNSGTTVDPAKLYYSKIKSYLAEVQGWVNLLNDAGKAAFRDEIAAALTFDDTNKIVYIKGDENVKVDTEQLYYITLQIIIDAYKAALLAHNDALKDNDFVNTPIIINPSFETGDFSGWTKVNVISSNGHTNIHENYIASSTTGSPLAQTIAHLPNGLYKLTGYVASEAGNTVFLTANSYHKGVVASSATSLQKVELDFLVEGNVVTIGVVGGSAVNGSDNMYYYAPGGCPFKADNFSLQYICDLNNGRLFMALKEATSAIIGFDVYGQAAIAGVLDNYQTIYDTRAATDGHTGEVFSHLQTAAKAQRTSGADMTYAILNHNFERGSMDGWSVPNYSSDTGVRGNRAQYSTCVTDNEGAYLFNTWWQGVPLTQTVGNIPNGDYKLEAFLASDNNSNLYLLANGEYSIPRITTGKEVFHDVSCDFEVSEGQAIIGAVGGNDAGEYVEGGYWWYKADNFRLTLINPSLLVLKETDEVVADIKDVVYPNVKIDRTINVGKNWSSFVLPFDMDIPEGWEVKEFCGGTVRNTNDGDNITLKFIDAERIEAGKPYMIRTNEEEKRTSVEAAEVNVNTTVVECCENTDCNSYSVEFVGVYTKGKIPASVEGGDQYFFISGNNFYRSVTGTDNIKGFRAYFKVKANVAGAPVLRSLSMRIDDETDIEEVVAEAEVIVIGIYDVNGIRLSEMKPGINILRMSNGTTKKVMVK